MAVQVSAKDRALSDAATRSRELATRAGELQQELDNNTGGAGAACGWLLLLLAGCCCDLLQ